MRSESHRVVQGPAPEGGKGRVTGNSRESCVQGVTPVIPQGSLLHLPRKGDSPT